MENTTCPCLFQANHYKLSFIHDTKFHPFLLRETAFNQITEDIGLVLYLTELNIGFPQLLRHLGSKSIYFPNHLYCFRRFGFQFINSRCSDAQFGKFLKMRPDSCHHS